jgi:hypothetical protein
MSACNFTIPFQGNAQAALARAKSAVKSQGGQFEGDENRGEFNVSVFGNAVKGSYSVAGNDLNVVIDSKPFLVPCSTIESFLRSQIGS